MNKNRFGFFHFLSSWKKKTNIQLIWWSEQSKSGKKSDFHFSLKHVRSCLIWQGFKNNNNNSNFLAAELHHLMYLALPFQFHRNQEMEKRPSLGNRSTEATGQLHSFPAVQVMQEQHLWTSQLPISTLGFPQESLALRLLCWLQSFGRFLCQPEDDLIQTSNLSGYLWILSDI